MTDLDAFLAKRRRQILSIHRVLDRLEARDHRAAPLVEATRKALNAGLFGYPRSVTVFEAVLEIARRVQLEHR